MNYKIKQAFINELAEKIYLGEVSYYSTVADMRVINLPKCQTSGNTTQNKAHAMQLAERMEALKPFLYTDEGDEERLEQYAIDGDDLPPEVS